MLKILKLLELFDDNIIDQALFFDYILTIFITFCTDHFYNYVYDK